LAETGKKRTDKAPQGIVIIRAAEDGFELKFSQELNYEDAKYLLVEALYILGFYEESSCIPDNMTLQ